MNQDHLICQPQKERLGSELQRTGMKKGEELYRVGMKRILEDEVFEHLNATWVYTCSNAAAAAFSSAALLASYLSEGRSAARLTVVFSFHR